MFRYTLRDESNHIEVFRNLFMDLVEENKELWTAEFKQELVDLMREAVELEKAFIRDCLPVNSVGLTLDEFTSYIDYIADRRLVDCGLPPLHPGLQDPLPWLDESIRQIKEKNFFETRVTSYQKVASFFSDLFRPQPEEALAGPDPRDLWAEARTTPVDAELPVAGEPGPSAGRAVEAAPTALAARLATPAPATGRETDYTIGTRVFRLDRGKAEAAYAAKRVIHGRESLTFNLLPLRYEWAYHLYKQMKQAHWGPLSPDISLEQDVRAWRAGALSEQEKQAVALCLGWLVSLPRLPGAGLQHLLRLHVTAPELKLVLGREPQDLNTRLETAVFLAQALGLNLHDCEAQFRQTVELDSREAWVRPHVEALTHCQDLSSPEATADFARAVYLAGPCLKGLAFASLHLLLQDWTTEGKCPGLSRLLSKILADEAHCLKVFQHLLEEAAAENPDLNQLSFGEALIHLLDECLAREKALLDRLLPPSTGDAARRLRLAGELDQLAQRLKIQPGKILSGRTILTLCSDDDF
jgi:ribonucleoside-diphosphate reductase beta chain